MATKFFDAQGNPADAAVAAYAVTTYSDGSYIDGRDGSVHAADGSVVPPSAITTSNAQNQAGAAAIYAGNLPDGKGGFVVYGDGHGAPYSSISLPQADGTIRPTTQDEANAQNSAAVDSDPLGLPGVGGPGGNPIQVLASTLTGGATDFANSSIGRSLGLSGEQGVPGLLSEQAASAASAANLRNLADAAVANPQAAPSLGKVAQAANAGTASTYRADATTLSPAAQAAAASAAGSPQVIAGQVGPVSGITASQVSAPSAVDAGGPVGAGTATAGQLDPTQQAQFRASQGELLGYLRGAITGQQPSVAALQLQQQAQQNEANQIGLAAANSRGGNAALARMTAANNIARLNQNLSAQQALQRAQEISTAEGQFGGAAEAGRQQDISLTGQQAALTTQASTANASLQTQAAISTAQNKLEAAKATAANELAAGQTNASLATQAAIQQAQNELAAATKQAELETAASTSNASNATAVNTLNAQLAEQAALANAAAQNQTSLAQGTIDANAAANYASAQNAAASAYTNSLNTTNQFNATSRNQQAQAQGTLQEQQNQANNAYVLGLAGAGNQAASTDIAAGSAVNQGNKNQADAFNNTLKIVSGGLAGASSPIPGAGAAGGGGADAAVAASDKRVKSDVHSGDKDVEALMSTIASKTYRYKYPSLPRGQHTGVMAQDLEKTPAGKGMVRDTPQGKVIDVGQGFGTFLASLANLHKRLGAVEGRK